MEGVQREYVECKRRLHLATSAELNSESSLIAPILSLPVV